MPFPFLAPVSSNAGERSGVDYTIYNQLTQPDQNTVKRISSMGFPLERVVWVLKRIGNDDKKVNRANAHAAFIHRMRYSSLFNWNCR